MRIPITRVVVHRDGAIVERRGSAKVAPGPLVISGLPLAMDRGSLRVQMGGARVSAVQLNLELPDVPPAEPGRLEELLAAEAELRQVEAAIAALQAERQAATQLAPGFDPEAGLPTPERLAKWVELETAVDPWVERVDATLRDERKRREALSRRVQELSPAAEGRAEEEHWDQWVPTQQAVIEVEGAGKVEIVLTYRVVGARWSPAYVLDTDASLHRGRFVMRAQVSQVAGEDWTGVALSLSTASCARSVALPELLPFRLGAHPPLPPAAWRGPPADFDTLFSVPEGPEDIEAGDEPDTQPPHRRRVSTWSEHDLGIASSDPGDGGSWSVEGLHEEEDVVEITAAGRERVPRLPPGVAGRVPRRVLPSPASQMQGVVDMIEEDARHFEVPDIRDGSTQVAEDRPTEVSPDGQDTAITALAGSDTEERPPPPGHVDRLPPSAAATPVSVPRERTPSPAHARAPRREPALRVGGPLLDYGRLRLGAHNSEPGIRGRLVPATATQILAEAERPPAAAERLACWIQEARGSVVELLERALPEGHRDPGPREAGHVTYEAAGEVDVPCDGRARWVAVFSEALALEVRYQAVPRHELRAYRRVTAPLVGDLDFLAGPVEVFVEGVHEITVPWEGANAGEALELSLGAEDRLMLARTVKYREEQMESPPGARRFHTTVDVRVTSELGQEVRLQLIERVPVPEDANGPEVEITTSTPAARPYLGEPHGPVLQGAKVQTLEVPALGEARAVLGYAIGLRTGQEIAGGDRRG